MNRYSACQSPPIISEHTNRTISLYASSLQEGVLKRGKGYKHWHKESIKIKKTGTE
jgi:hypothetical protein